MIKAVHAVKGSIMAFGVLTHCAFLHSVCDLKATYDLMLYEFKLGPIVMEVTKNISCTKGKSVVDHHTVSR